jgi:glycosyltransferase involved in cell wall biosynthesis
MTNASTNRPLIAIVMPSFNHARFIRAAIDSVLAQDYRPIELLVMDGGSTDGTVDILRGYGSQLRFVSQRDNGQSDALNRGFQRVGGDILCWLNSDDLFLPGALTKVADAFRRHPEAGFVYGRGMNVNEAGLRPRDSGVLPFNLWKLIHHRNFLHQPSCFFRRSLWQEAGPIRTDLHYVMDWELWIRLASRPGHFIDSPLSCNRSYAENKTNSGAFRRWDEIRRMVKPYAGQSCPPVVWIYLLETILQKLSGKYWLNPIRNGLNAVLQRCMKAEFSGWYADGGVATRFRFTMPNRPGADSVRVVLEPLSSFDPARRGGPPVTIHWCNGQARGVARLLENGCRQVFELPLARRRGALFTHFSCRAAGQAVNLEKTLLAPARSIVAFLDIPVTELVAAAPDAAPGSIARSAA